MGGDFFLHRDCRFVQIGFYLHRVRRPSARSEDGRVRRMVASGEFSQQEFGWAQEFGRARPGPGFRYTEIADSWRLDFIYTEIADALVLAGL